MLLYEKALERRAEEAERMTIAVANGYAIARDKKARESWEAGRRRRRGPRASVPQTRAEFRATLSRLGAVPGLTVKVH